MPLADRAAIRTQKKAIKRLEMELRRKGKALAEAAALLVLQKNPVSRGGSRGRKIDHAERLKVVELIKEASIAGARQSKACKVVGIYCSDGMKDAPGSGRWPGSSSIAQATQQQALLTGTAECPGCGQFSGVRSLGT